jgi:F-type H+-transporting ATPase subunit b
MNILTQFASTEPASGGIFTALGIDWKMLIFQIVAFVVLVWLLGKFVYPILIKTIDARHEEIKASTKAAQEAEKQAIVTSQRIEKLLKEARVQASDIVLTAKEEATAAAEAADAKAKTRTERIIADAHQQIAKDILSAKKALHNETLELVAQATEKVVGVAVTPSVDEHVIADALREAR